MPISSEYGMSPAWFGHADYQENLKKGYSNQEILDFLNQNKNLLRERNVPGAGGLYDEISASIERSKPAEGSTQDDYFDIGKFESLLGRLEDSKQRQQRQKSVEKRRDIMALGEAGMMSNF